MSQVASSANPINWGNISELLQGNAPKKIEASGTDRLANKEVFLQLLVAQLKHQNPLSPADGVEFVTQLAQFTQLEQTFGMRDELKAIRKSVSTPAPAEDTQVP